MDDNLKQLKSYVKEKKMTWPQISTRGSGDAGWDTPLAKKYGISSIPAVMIIDPQGRVVEAGLPPGAIDSLLRYHLQ